MNYITTVSIINCPRMNMKDRRTNPSYLEPKIHIIRENILQVNTCSNYSVEIM